MYGIKQLQFDYSYPDPACDACASKHVSLFSLGEYCKVYDHKTCVFSDLAKEQIHLCKNCIYALRKSKVYQTRCFNAQKVLNAYISIYPDHHQPSPTPAPPEETTQHVARPQPYTTTSTVCCHTHRP